MNRETFQYHTAPYDHQRMAFDQTKDYQYYAFFWEMGTGKSKIIVDTSQHLFVEGKIDSAIITAEKGYYLNWELNEYPIHWPTDLPIRIISFSNYTTSKNKKLQEEMVRPIPGVFDVLVMNIESMSSVNMSGMKYAERFRSAHKSTLMVVDESTTIKNPEAGRTKMTRILGHKCQYRRILTGTPITQGPIDIYSQAEFLKSGILGFGSFTSFRSFYTIRQPVPIRVAGGQQRVIQQVVGYRELDDLAMRLQPFSSRLLKKDCLSLPEKIYVPIFIEPTAQQIHHIERLKTELMTEIDNESVTVENALSVLTKSLQIAGGHIKNDDGDVMSINCNKGERLKQLIEDVHNDGKIIVWGYFQHDMEIIQNVLKDVCPVFEVSGRVDQNQRTQNIATFKEYKGKCVFLASPRVAGKSLTLVESNYCVYYSNGFNLEHRLQSEDRNHRIGQRNDVTYFDLICTGTPDVKVVAALKAKEIVSQAILSKIKTFFEG